MNDPHDKLIKYIQSKYYKDRSVEEVGTAMLADSATFDRALRAIHNDVYKDIDYGEFVNSYYSKNGNPFEKKNLQPTSGGGQDFPTGYSWAGASEKLATGDYDHTQTIEEPINQAVVPEMVELANNLQIKRKGDHLNFDTSVDPAEAGERIRGQEKQVVQDDGSVVVETHEPSYEYNLKYDMATDQRRDMRKLKNVEVYMEQLANQQASAALGLEDRYGKDWDTKFVAAMDTFEKLKNKEDLSGEEELALQNAYFDLKNFEDDPDFVRFRNAQEGVTASQAKIKEVMGDRRMQEIQAEIKQGEELEGTWKGYLNYIGNKIGGISSRSVSGTLGIPTLIDGLFREKKTEEDWGIWDTWGSMIDLYEEEAAKTLANTSSISRPTFERIARYNGKQFVLDENDNVSVVRDDNGKDITDTIPESEYDAFYESGVKAKNKFTGVTPLLDKALDVTADFLIMRGMALGLGARASTLEGAKKLSLTGAMIPSFATISRGAYKEGRKDLELQPDEAAKYAIATGLVQSAIEATVGNIETRTGKSLVSKSAMDARRSVMAQAGKLSGSELAKLRATTLLKDVIGENAEEVMQALSDNMIKAYTNSVTRSNLDTTYDKDELVESLLLTTLVTAPASLSATTGLSNQFKGSAYLLASKKPDKYKAILDELLSSGVITDDVALFEKAKVDAIQSKVNNIPEELTTEEKTEVAGLIAQAEDMNNESLPISKEARKERIKELEGKIDGILVGSPETTEPAGEVVSPSERKTPSSTYGDEFKGDIMTEGGNEITDNLEVKAAEAEIERAISESKSLDEFSQKNQYTFDEEIKGLVDQFVEDRIEGKTDQSFAEWRRGKPKPTQSQISKKLRVDSPEKAILEFFLDGGRIKSEHLDRYGDPNMTKGTISKANYASKTGEDIDILAARIADEYGIDEKKAIEMIIDFIHENPKGPKAKGEEVLEQQKGIEQPIPEGADRIDEFVGRVEAGESIEEVTKGMPQEVIDAVTDRVEENEMGAIEEQMTDEEIDAFNDYVGQFEKDGELDMDALAQSWTEAVNNFDPEILNMPQETITKIDNLVNKYNERKAQKSQKVPKQTSKGQKAKARRIKKPRTAVAVRGARTKFFDTLKKAFPNMEVVEDAAEIAAAQAAANTTAPAFVWEGKIFIDASAGDLELAEEVAHVWVDLAKDKNSPIYVKATRDIMALNEFAVMRSDPAYNDLTDQQVADEILAQKVAAKAAPGVWILPSNLTPSNASLDKIVNTIAKEISSGKAISQATSAEIDAALDGAAMEISSRSALNPKNTAARKTMRFIDEFFTTSKGLDVEGLRNEMERNKNRQRAILLGIEIKHRQLQGLIKKSPDKAALMEKVANVFNGSEVVTNLPVEIQPVIQDLMALRTRFRQQILDELVANGDVIMDADLKQVLTENYDYRTAFESAVDQLETDYNEAFEIAQGLTTDPEIERMYEEYARKKAQIANERRKLIAKELDTKVKLKQKMAGDVPARIQKLLNELRDIQANIDKLSPKATLDPAATAVEKAQRKVIDKQIKQLKKDLDAITPGTLTITELDLIDDIEDLQGVLEAMMTSGVIDKEGLLKLVDEVKRNDTLLKEKELSMRETIGFRYKVSGSDIEVELTLKDGSTTKATISKDDLNKLVGKQMAEDVLHNVEGYHPIRNPKIYYNNELFESVLRGTDYVNRSYMMHDHKGFKDNIVKYIGQDAYDDAVAFLDRQYSDKRIAGVRKEKKPNGETEYIFTNIYGVESKPVKIDDPKEFFRMIGVSERQINAIEQSDEYTFRGAKGKYVDSGVTFRLSARQMDELISEIVSVEDLAYLPNDLKAGQTKVNTGALKKRKNIAPEIRALMGEYLDPRVNIFRTLTKAAVIAEQTKFNRWFIDNGMDIYISRKPTAQHTVKISKGEIPTMKDGEVLYTTKEVYDAMWGDDRAMDNIVIRMLTQASGWTKAMLTVGSNTSQARNFLGAAMNMMASGNVGAITNLAEAVRIVSQDFTKGESMGTAMSFPLLMVRGLVHKNFGYNGNDTLLSAFQEAVEAGLVESSADIGEFQDALNMIDEFAITKGQKAKAAFKKAGKIFSKTYQMSDSVFKVAQYMNEKERYMRAGYSLEDAKKKAAEITKNTQPTYSRAPKVLRMLSRNPFLGDFILFRAEIFRTRYNILRLGIEEMRSDNPELKKVGIKRLTSLAATSFVTMGLAAAATAWMGMDDGEEEAVRVLSPEYFENNQWIPIGLDDGKLTYIDGSFIDPSSDFHRAIEAALRGKDVKSKAGGSMEEMFGEYVNYSILLQRAGIDLIKNQDLYGRKIYQEGDDPLPKALDIIKHAAEPAIPGIVWNVESLTQAIVEVASKAPKESDIYVSSIKNEVLNNLFGIKMKTRDYKNHAYYRLQDLEDEYKSHRVYYNQNPSDATLKKSMRKMDETFAKMLEAYKAGGTLFNIEEVAKGKYNNKNLYPLDKTTRSNLRDGKIKDYNIKKKH